MMENFGELSPSEQERILSTEPSIQPPDGIIPNFDNPPTRNDVGIPVVTIMLLLVTITGLLRLYSRVCVPKVLKLEDCESKTTYNI